MQVFSDGWYTVSNFKEGVWGIDDHGMDSFYAVIGDERALMIDTGYGAGNLEAIMARLSDKPWFAVNTHSDMDHCLGNDFFDEVYIGPGDIDTLNGEETELKRDVIRQDPRMTKSGRDMSHIKSLGGSLARKKTHLLTDGQVFDLGGRQVTAHLIPGHTEGSACFIDDKSRTLFMGDMYVPLQEWNELWCHMPRCTPVQGILESIEKVSALKSRYDTIVSGHGSNYAMEAARLDEFVNGLRDLVAGRVVGEPVVNCVGAGYACRFGRVGIIYDPERLQYV